MNFAALMRALPGDFRLTLADIGSAGGMHRRWRPLRPVVSAMLFEPREGSDVERKGADTIYPIALGQQAGRSTLNITALPNMSSTLMPDAARLATYRKKGAHTTIQSSIDIPVDALDAVAARDGRTIDALKVDTQGSEIEILRGATATLSGSVILAEVEVSFFPRYVGQALAWDIVAFMAEQGFELLDLSRLKRYRRINSAGIGNRSLGGGQRAGQLAYGDAVFLMREDRLLARIASASAGEAEATAIKAILCLLVYGKADMAAHMFDRTRAAIDADRASRIAAALQSLGRGPLREGVLHHLFDYMARRV